MVTGRLAEYINHKELTYGCFEKSIGVSKGSISKAVRDKMSISSSTLEKVATIYPDLNPVWLLTGKGEMISTLRPQHVTLPVYKNLLRVKSDNMFPLLRGGDTVMFKKVKPDNLIFGQLYYIALDEYSTIAYVRQGSAPGTIVLVNENKIYQEKEIAVTKIRTLGHIKASIRINTLV